MPNIIDKGTNIIYIFFPDDFNHWFRKYRINSLLKTNTHCRVIGIRYPVSLGTLFSNPIRFLNMLAHLREKIDENLWILTFLSIMPVRILDQNKILSKFHHFIFSFQLRLHLHNIEKGGNKYHNIIWASTITRFPLYCHHKNYILIYNCLDELTMNQQGLIPELKIIENELLSKADIVFAASRYLYEQKKHLARNCFYIPNGVSEIFFNCNMSAHNEAHDLFKDIKKPVVGYVGNIRSWLDFDLLIQFAERFKNASFVFVGKISQDIEQEIMRFKYFSNVFFINRRAYEKMPSIISMFDIALIPFKINQFNLATNPIKAMEYMALGKPILSPNILELQSYSDVLALYKSPAEAITKLEQLLQNPENADFVRKRREIAGKNNVDAFSRQIHKIINGFIKVNENI